MIEKEEVRTQVGILNLPRNAAYPDDKVLKVFTKLKRKANEVEKYPPHSVDDGTPILEHQHSAMNSYRVGLEVAKTEDGYKIK